MAKLTDPSVANLLAAPNFATLTTIGEDDSPTSSIVWFNLEDGRVAVNGAKGRHWTGNAARDGRVALLVPDAGNPYAYVEIRGRAVLSDEDPEGHIDRLAKKYLGRDEYPFRQPGEERQKFFLEPDVIRHQKQ